MRERLVWAILLSRHAQSSMQFYGSVLGWRFEAFENPRFPCWIATSGDDDFRAVFVDTSASDFPDAPELWLPHFTVEDIDERVAQAEKEGATILRGPFDVPGFGRLAALRQPGGGIVAWRSPPAP
jgi:uncharacterized protein